MPHKWKCVTCGKEYRRHRKTIDTDKHSCGACKGRLTYAGKFDRQDRLVGAAGARVGD